MSVVQLTSLTTSVVRRLGQDRGHLISMKRTFLKLRPVFEVVNEGVRDEALLFVADFSTSTSGSVFVFPAPEPVRVVSTISFFSTFLSTSPDFFILISLLLSVPSSLIFPSLLLYLTLLPPLHHLCFRLFCFSFQYLVFLAASTAHRNFSLFLLANTNDDDGSLFLELTSFTLEPGGRLFSVHKGRAFL